MAIRFYMNGTEGATDGTEISSGDSSNPLVADGFYPAIGTKVSKNIKIMIRADAGEVWKCVPVTVVSTTTNEISKFSVKANNGIGDYGSNRFLAFFPEITDKNLPLTLTVSANGNESNSPDTTQKLMIVGGVKIA